MSQLSPGHSHNNNKKVVDNNVANSSASLLENNNESKEKEKEKIEEDERIGHTFLSSISEVKNMESSLLNLLNSFHQGDLSAFGKGKSLRKAAMEEIRTKQEKLAKLHFEICTSKQCDNASANNWWLSDDEQNNLVADLRDLSVEIERLFYDHQTNENENINNNTKQNE